MDETIKEPSHVEHTSRLARNADVDAAGQVVSKAPFEDGAACAPAMHHMADDLAGKTLLLLAGADPHRKVVEAAHELGVRVIVADYLPPEQSPAKRIADESWLIDVFDVDALVQRCLAERVDGVLNFCSDAPQMAYQQICERLGLPCFGTKEQFAILSDKRAFKAYCQAHGLLTIPSFSESDIEAGRAEFPLFVKPADGRGSRGQTICRTPGEVGPAIEVARAASRAGEVVIEKYLGDKQDFSISCFIIDGVAYPIKLGDRYCGSAADGLERQHICTLSPTVQLDAFLEKTMPRIDAFVRDLGIAFGALFIQGFIEDGDVYCYDPGLRLPGGDFDLIARDVTGFDPMKSAINFALTGDVCSCHGDARDAFRLNGGVGVILSIDVGPGEIAQMAGVEDVAGDARIHGVSVRRHVGDVVEATGDTGQRALEFVAYLDRRDQLGELFDFVYDHIEIRDGQGRDMMVSRARCTGNGVEVI